ncbi:MAG: hypothetical protein ACJ8F1_15665 [Polyangia bacterium]
MKSSARGALLVGVIVFAGCGGSKSVAPPVDATGTGGVSTGGVRGSGGAAGQPVTGAAGAGVAGTGGREATGGHDATGGSASGGAAGRAATGGNAGSGTGGARDAGVATHDFTCTLLLGNSTTQQWFDGGFLTYPGIDATRWELIAVAHHYVGAWADANDTAWTTPLDGGHACAHGAQTPDRVIFIVTQSPPYPPESTYRTQTTSVVQNIRSKYPGAREIALATLIRSPGNAAATCSAATDNEQSIPAAEDQAIAAVVAATAPAGLVVALPPFYVPTCGDFVADHPQYTTAGATDIAKLYGAYFAAHP